MAVVTAMLEAIAAAAVFGVVRMLADPAAAVPLLGGLQDWLPAGEPRDVVITVLLLLIGLYALRGAFLAGAVHLRHSLAGSSATGLAGRLFQGYLAAPYAFHLHR